MKRLEFFLIRLSLFIVFVVLLGTLSSIIGYFKIYTSFILPILFLCFLVWVFYQLNNYKIFKISLKKDFRNYQVLFIIWLLIFSIINGFFYHEIVDSARDDGVYTLSAVYLAKNGNIFSQEKDLYFTGFSRIKDNFFVLQFLPGYFTYLAIFYFYGGFLALFLASSLLLFLSTFFIFKTGELIGGFKTGLMTTILFSTHYTTFWFSRRTNSENLFLLLFWLIVFLIFKFIKKKKINPLICCLPPLLLLFLTRPEAILYVLMFVIAMIIVIAVSIRKTDRQILGSFTPAPLFFTLISLVIFITAVILLLKQGANYWQDYKNYKVILLGTTKRLTLIISSKLQTLKQVPLIPGNAGREQIRTPFVYQDFTAHSIRYVIDVLTLYFILPPLIFALVFLKRIFNLKILILFLLAFPSFIYLIHPQITPDQPWMMRRYWPVLIPLVYLLFSYAVGQLKKKQAQTAIISIIILINLILSSPIIAFAEGRGSLAKLEELNQKLKAADFIFFGGSDSRWASSMYFIFNKKTMTGYTKKENFLPPLEKYDNIYVISDMKENIHPLILDTSLKFENTYSFKILRLKRSMKEIVGLKTFGYDFIEQLLPNVPPRQIHPEAHKFNIYRLTSKDFLKNIKPEDLQL